MHVVPDESAGPLVGFVVPRSVGGAVVRNKVKRRLRHLVCQRLDALSETHVVVRALPGAQDASWASLADDLDGAVRTATRRLAARLSDE